jgi:hypothetical protein
MSKDNDGLCATAEAFVYVAMTRPMVFFRVFHVAIAVEMLLAIAYVWWYALSGRRRRLLHIAAASLIGEGMLISVNGGNFPLGGLQERIGDPVPLFELVVSPRAAKQAGPTLGAITSSTLPPGSFCKLCILRVEARRVGPLTSAMQRSLRRACRAEERTRTAYPCSLRVCGLGLLSVAHACKFRISKRFFVPSLAHYCGVLRPG